MADVDLTQYITDFPDFPEKGVVFRDISPLLANPEVFSKTLDKLVGLTKQFEIDTIVAVDARGFIFGAALADRLKKGLVLCRKASKLPGELVTESYSYEYNKASLSLQKTALKPGDQVLLVDDVLASGSTALAAHNLVAKLGGSVAAFLFLIELTYLDGRDLLTKEAPKTAIQSLIHLEAS